MRTKLRRYQPGRQQGGHRDSTSRITLVLRGAFSEDGPSGSFEFGPGDVLLKSEDVKHQDAFGPHGAALLSVEFENGHPGLTRLGEGSWCRRRGASTLRLGLALLRAATFRDPNAIDIAASDILADSDLDSERGIVAPIWLLRLKEELETSSLAQVDVGARAREAGIHPAHLSRLFRRVTGVSITEHAQTHSVRRALQIVAETHGPLSDVAAAAGFYDQSHMNRVFRRICGLSPGAHRTLVERVMAVSG
jgi:AraC family transcriptional regulator